MDPREANFAARGITDRRDRLLSADDALAELQQGCGGMVPGDLAIPSLLDLVRQARGMGLRIAREFTAFDGTDNVTGFARIRPLDDDAGGGCEVIVENWHQSAADHGSSRETAEKLDAIDRASAEVSGRLDSDQKVQLLEIIAPDLEGFTASFSENPGQVWTDYVELGDVAHQQPLHWRLLDGSRCKIAGSDRNWRVRLLPLGQIESIPRGFDFLLVADEPAPLAVLDDAAADTAESRLIGTALTPALRKPISRVIANAETIKAKLAGPLRDEYSEYAGNIAAAGQHLSSMLDDLADLEVVEAPGFKTIKERVNLADVARRAGGILGVRAQTRSISLHLPGEDDAVIAKAEFRRVLQILINLIGNAIAYSPQDTAVTVEVSSEGEGIVSVSVSDQGPGISEDQAERIFDKFERLGRDSDGGKDAGSGLGLYISRKLARAMDGDLVIAAQAEHPERSGATFVLTLPAHTR